MRLLSKTLLASLVAVASQGAFASAFQLHETSTSGLGRAYAGDAAVAEDASVVASNPALMTFFKRPEISVGGIYMRPNVDLNGTFSGSAPALGVALPAVSASHQNIASKEILPFVYGVYPMSDRFAMGGGVNVNYGLATEFDNTYNAGVLGGKTDLTTINFNLSGAYRVTNNFSVGAGLNAVYADAVIERRLGAIGQIPLAAALGVNNSSIAKKLKGNEWGYGWNVGAVYEFNENNRIGVAYHSHVSIDFDGDYSTDLPLGAESGSGSLKLPLPAYWEIAGYHRILPKFAVTYSVKRTEWSRLEELYGHRGSQELFKKVEKFNDTTRIALGFIYDVDDKLTLRAGVAYDESAANKNHSSISIPDTDRTWYTLGATYRFTPNLSLDAGFAFVKGKKTVFQETESLMGGLVNLEGNFTSKSTATLYGLGLNYRF